MNLNNAQISRKSCDTHVSRFNESELNDYQVTVIKWKNLGKFGGAEISCLFKVWIRCLLFLIKLELKLIAEG